MNNASGTPAISLNKATGSIAGTSGTNSSIVSAIENSGSNLKWKSVWSGSKSVYGTSTTVTSVGLYTAVRAYVRWYNSRGTLGYQWVFVPIGGSGASSYADSDHCTNTGGGDNDRYSVNAYGNVKYSSSGVVTLVAQSNSDGSGNCYARATLGGQVTRVDVLY